MSRLWECTTGQRRLRTYLSKHCPQPAGLLRSCPGARSTPQRPPSACACCQLAARKSRCRPRTLSGQRVQVHRTYFAQRLLAGKDLRTLPSPSRAREETCLARAWKRSFWCFGFYRASRDPIIVRAWPHSRNHSYQSQTLEGWPQTRHQLVPDSRRLPDT